MPAIPKHSPLSTEKLISFKLVSKGSSLVKLRSEILINLSDDTFAFFFINYF